MVNSYNYDGNRYMQRSNSDAWTGYMLASALSGGLYKLSGYLNKPFEKQLLKEHANNHLYKDSFKTAFDLSHLEFYDCKVSNAQYESGSNVFKAGLNAAYIPEARTIRINTDKACITSFHEMGHAMNHLMSRNGKFLQKLRYPGYAIAGLMEYFAIFSRTKPKDAPRNITDIIEDNCGKIAFCAMLPTLAEEALASHKGIKLAKKAGLAEPLIKNLKKFYAKALLTYASHAVFAGIAVAGSRMIMDYFTRPKKIENDSALFI